MSTLNVADWGWHNSQILMLIVVNNDRHSSLFPSLQHPRSSNSSINTTLDFAAIIKASQALARMIQLEDLIYQLTQIILQNSGGDRCALMLTFRKSSLRSAGDRSINRRINPRR